MTTKVELEDALKRAMRSGDDVAKRTLRMVLSAVQLAEVSQGKPLDQAGLVAVLQKEVKTRQETIEEARRAGREDLAESTEAEIGVLAGYLPAPLSPDELRTLAQQAIAEVGAASPADMGKVMRVLMPRIQGRATGDQVSQTVRQLLG